MHNPNARDASNYSMVEDLSQTPCAMSALEVLQICPAQRDALLAALGSMDSLSLMEKFHLTDVKIHLPYHVALSIDVIHGGNAIGRVVVDEDASTCPCHVGKLLDPQSWSRQTPYLLLSTKGHSIHMVSYWLLKLSWKGKHCLLR